jgi:hypothetical protein
MSHAPNLGRRRTLVTRDYDPLVTFTFNHFQFESKLLVFYLYSRSDLKIVTYASDSLSWCVLIVQLSLQMLHELSNR